MKVFISWSGERSKSIALKLREWLPLVMQNVIPWMSAEDIRAGARWGQEIQDELRNTTYGIICLTPENTEAPWIMFEAGALAKTVLNAAVCPYVIGQAVTDLPGGPLTQFQAKSANRDGTWDLVRSVNEAMGERCLDERKLMRTFEAFWPDLEKTINGLPVLPAAAPTSRPESEMLREILETVRSIARSRTQPRTLPIRISADVLDGYQKQKLDSTAEALITLGLQAYEGRISDLPEVFNCPDCGQAMRDAGEYWECGKCGTRSPGKR